MPRELKIVLPSEEYLKECLSFDPETGILTWKKRPTHHFSTTPYERKWNARFPKKTAGYVLSNGYRHVTINNVRYFAHRIAWKIMTGGDAAADVDHRDGVRGNDRWDNLRLASRSQNSSNTKTYVNNALGLKGVRKSRNKLASRITVEGKSYWLGLHNTAEDAYAAYCEAARRLHGEFANTGEQ